MQKRKGNKMAGFPRSRILINRDIVATMPEHLFNHRAHLDNGEYSNSGRGAVVRFQHQGRHLVLKTYHRGGLPGRFIRESYLYTGVEKTRMWQEHHLLHRLHGMGLPVPRPVAARCVLITPFIYRGELMIEEIRDSRTLVEVIRHEPLPEEAWSRIGALIADFHQQGVYHGDLNASNILLSEDGGMHLIDFDKCGIRASQPPGSNGWPAANLNRLKRSLQKYADRIKTLHFTDKDWQGLISGYTHARNGIGNNRP